MTRFILPAALALALVFGLAAGAAEAATREQTVRCNSGGTIAAGIRKALSRVQPGDKILIKLRGTCRESPTITVDDVTIRSDGARATVKGTIRVVGARRVVIKKLRITGPGPGISLKDGAVVDIIDNFVEKNERDGIKLEGRSFARITNNRVHANGRSPPFTDSGINIFQSGVRSRGNRIKDNGFAAVRVSGLGRFRSGSPLSAGAAAAATEANSADRDVLVQRGCSEGQSAGSCGATGTMALEVVSSALADLRDDSVTGETMVDGQSYLEVGAGKFNGNIGTHAFSSATILADVSGSGSIGCDDGGDAFGAVGCGDSIPPPP